MLSHSKGLSSGSRFSRSITRHIDKVLQCTSSINDKNNLANSDSNDKKNKYFDKTKKTIKAEEKCLVSNEGTSKSVNWDPDKGKMKEILNVEMNTDTLNNSQIVEDKIVGKKKYAKNFIGKLVQKSTKKEKVKYTDSGLPGSRKKKVIKEQFSNIKVESFDEKSPVIVGDTVAVYYYRDKQAKTYEVKVRNSKYCIS